MLCRVTGRTAQIYKHSYVNMLDRQISLSLQRSSTSLTTTTETPKKIETDSMLPAEVVKELNKYIVGQDEAKKAVAVALRNRWRRRQLEPELRKEVMPKNILMIGPTGVGKTEIARRLAQLSMAPFIKVEATKYTEVGFHGKDVDQIIRDLADIGVKMQRTIIADRNKEKIEEEVENKLLDLLVGVGGRAGTRDTFKQMLKEGQLDDREVEVDVGLLEGPVLFPGGKMEGLQDIAETIKSLMNMRMAGSGKTIKITVKNVRPYLRKAAVDKMYTPDMVAKEALDNIEQNGIVFIDEIDKICANKDSHKHADASDEGVQRDLLPIIEGTIIGTKYGNVDTSKILFIASGAFHRCKPSDLLAELQGRLPIRVELKALTVNDLYKILTEPQYNLLAQQKALLATEGITMNFTDSAILKMAELAAEVNRTVENIGARRLYTVIEKIVEDISFNSQEYKDKTVTVDDEFVENRLRPMLVKTDLTRFIL